MIGGELVREARKRADLTQVFLTGIPDLNQPPIATNDILDRPGFSQRHEG